MPAVTFLVALLLVAVGLGGFFASGAQHPTALIPAVLGALLAGCGALARNPKLRMHAMHAAVLLALLGVLGSVRGAVKLPGYLAGHPVERPLAVVAQSATVVLCLAYVVVAVRSFIQARRSRLAGQTTP